MVDAPLGNESGGIGDAKMRSTRRDVLKVAAGIVAAVSGVTTSAEEIVPSSFPSTGSPDVSHRGMLNRELGRTGVNVSAIGVGGHHLGDFPSVDDAIRMVDEAQMTV